MKNIFSIKWTVYLFVIVCDGALAAPSLEELAAAEVKIEERYQRSLTLADKPVEERLSFFKTIKGDAKSDTQQFAVRLGKDYSYLCSWALDFSTQGKSGLYLAGQYASFANNYRGMLKQLNDAFPDEGILIPPSCNV